LTLLLGWAVRNAFFLLPILAALAPKQDKRILRSLNVVLVAFLWPALDIATGG
jgi:hypothetical protein